MYIWISTSLKPTWHHLRLDVSRFTSEEAKERSDGMGGFGTTWRRCPNDDQFDSSGWNLQPGGAKIEGQNPPTWDGVKHPVWDGAYFISTGAGFSYYITYVTVEHANTNHRQQKTHVQFVARFWCAGGDPSFLSLQLSSDVRIQCISYQSLWRLRMEIQQPNGRTRDPMKVCQLHRITRWNLTGCMNLDISTYIYCTYKCTSTRNEIARISQDILLMVQKSCTTWDV